MSEIEWLYIFGENLNDMLIEQDISRNDFANAIGVDRSTVSRYINKQQMPTVKNIVNMAYVLRCDVDELINFDEHID